MTRRETAVAVLVGLAGASVTMWMARDVWFHADFWGLLQSHDLSFRGIFEPHAGHLAIFHVMTTQILYRIVGLDPWPWFYLPRALAWSGLVLLLWWILRSSGVDRWLAGAFLVVFQVFALSGWLMGWLVGNPMAIGFGVAAAYVIGRHPKPNGRHALAVYGLLVSGAASTSLGVAGLLGVGLGLALLLHRGRYWWSWFGAAGTYATWFFTLGAGGGDSLSSGGFSTLLEMPKIYAEILANAVTVTTGLPMLLGWVGSVGLIGWLGYLFVRRRLGAMETILLAWSCVFVVLVSLSRIARSQSSPTTARYGYLVLILVLVAALVHVPMPEGRAWRAGVLLVGLCLVPVNAIALGRGIDFWVARSGDSREVVETAAALIGAGEPYLPGAGIDDPRAGQLNARGLERLVSDGWLPPVHPEAEAVARGELRISVRPAQRSLPECRELAEPELVPGPSEPFEFFLDTDESVTLTFVDEYGEATAFATGPIDRVVTLVQSDATLTIEPEGAIEVCR